jgi:hypothetical protein
MPVRPGGISETDFRRAQAPTNVIRATEAASTATCIANPLLRIYNVCAPTLRRMTFQSWRKIAPYAQRCPSPHNTQPFRLRIVDDARADLVFLPRRGLPTADPFGRFTWLTAGIFVEICSIAAHSLGQELAVEWDHRPMYADGDTETPQVLARLILSACDRPTADLNPQLILDRQTSRHPYDGDAVPLAVIAELQAEAERLGHRLETRTDREAIRWVVELNRQALFHDLDNAPVRDELTKWLRYDSREEDLMRDGLSARC